MARYKTSAIPRGPSPGKAAKALGAPRGSTARKLRSRKKR